MKETKFTKGEWAANCQYVVSEGETVCEVVCGDEGESFATANLIAEAPAMYNMLKQLLDNDSINDFTIDIEVARLLAKARGENV